MHLKPELRTGSGRPCTAHRPGLPSALRRTDKRGSGARARALPVDTLTALDVISPAVSHARTLYDVSELGSAVSASVSGGGLEEFLYNAGQSADALVSQQLAGVTPVTYLVVLLAGLATSLSPCTLSVLPLTIGYIGGYSSGAAAASSGAAASEEPPRGEAAASSGEGGTAGRSTSGVASGSLFGQAASFSLGLATTLAALGLVSSSVGQAYGQIGEGLPIAVALVAIVMGLNLLEVLPLQLPSLDVDVRSAPVPPAARAYLAGLTFALAASPCSTPVLATLLAYVSTTSEDNPLQGGALLLAYSLGYVAPLLAAATFTGALRKLLSLRQYSAWITPASGALLLGGGSYTLLSRLLS